MGRAPVIASVVALALLAAAPAAAKPGKLRTGASAAIALEPGTSATAKANCPAGTRAVGGGFAASPPFSPGIAVITESRLSRRKAWRVSALGAGTGPSTFTAYVYCRRETAKIEVEFSGAPVFESSGGVPGSATATATCLPGRTVTAGGFEVLTPGTPGVFGIVEQSVRAGNRGWSAGASNITNSPVVIRSFAYCVAREKLGPTRTETATLTGPNTLGSARASGCRRAIGVGGFQLSPATPGQNALWLYESRVDGSSWIASAGQGAGGTGTLTSLAYC